MHNLSEMERLIAKTKTLFPETELILFPELSATGYFLTKDIVNYAEKAEGNIYVELARLAQAYQLFIGYGFVEKGENGEVFNSISLLDRNGERLATYQKIHLTPLELDIFTPGQKLVTVQTELGHIGLMICWDQAFPELGRLLTLQGAELLLVPSAWEAPYHHAYQRFAQGRAIDNTVYVATCNHIGESMGLSFFGKSSIYLPDGNVLNQAKTEQEEIVYGVLDFHLQEKLKKSFYTMLRERKSKLYTLQWNGEIGNEASGNN